MFILKDTELVVSHIYDSKNATDNSVVKTDKNARLWSLIIF